MVTILRKLLLGAFILTLPILASAQSNLKLYFSYGIFAEPGTGPYLEIYTKALASTLCHKKINDSTYGSGINIEYALMAGDSIKAHENYIVRSPNLKDTNNLHIFLLDMHRSWLEPGDYVLKFVCRDINNPDIYNSTSLPIKIAYKEKTASFGHLLILDTSYSSSKESSFTRDDKVYIPYVSNLHTMERKSISFYTELYNIENLSGKMENITIQYYIQDLKGRIIAGCDDFAKKIAKKKITVSGSLNISKLPTGEYTLCVVARNEQQFILTKTGSIFLRVNDPLVPGYDLGKNMFINFITIKEVADFAPYIEIISDKDEVESYKTILKAKDTMSVKKWFFDFWKKRDHYSAGTAYAQFMNRLDSSNKLYTYNGAKGFESDRGHTYLRYGPPDRLSITAATDNTYPYEVWTYNDFGAIGKVHFIFYRCSKTDNHFIMLHADVKGFAYDPNWMDKIKLKAKNGWIEEKKVRNSNKH